MSLLDNVLVLGENVAASSETTFNVLDLGLEGRSLSGNRHGAGYLNVFVLSDVKTASIALNEGDTNEPATLVDTTSIKLDGAKAGDYFTVKLPKKLKRYVTVKVEGTDEGKITAYIGVPVAEH